VATTFFAALSVARAELAGGVTASLLTKAASTATLR